ncbi:MAG: M28 family peptidase [Acidimicrobiales bacterium]|nr:M28 family peptidase [Acidimicrobiales bacterium]
MAPPTFPSGLDEHALPSTSIIETWIEEVFSHGVRRPGYDADVWAEQFIAEQFRDFGLESVRLELANLTRWTPHDCSVRFVTSDGTTREIDAFPLPHAPAVADLEVELVVFDDDHPELAAGKAALVDAPLLSAAPATFAHMNVDPDDTEPRVYDPDGTFADESHLLPFTRFVQDVTDSTAAAGAAVFLGTLTGYPADSFRYYVPYTGEPGAIPGVWISGTDGAWLRERAAEGPVTVHISIDVTDEPFVSHNVVGELPGADDEVVMIGSHHDGPWSSAVEDGTGIALVLAQAKFWATQPPEARPHRLVFVVQAGHMCGAAGLHAYIETHRDVLEQVVLAVHLEHAALDAVERDGELVVSDRCTPRWFFTSRNPNLERSVFDSIVAEDLRRSMLLVPDAIGPRPTTDGSYYFDEGVPIVQFLSAPFYLFDEMDTLDKVDRTNLLPLTRAAVRIVESTRGVSASAMRAGTRSS